MFHSRDRFNFRSPKGSHPFGRRDGMDVPRYAGLPPAVELFDRWAVQVWDLGTLQGQEAFVDSPASPDETANGAEWTQTQLTGSTLTIVDTASPAYLRVLTAATDGQGQQMQANIGAGGATKTLYSPATVEELFFSITLRFADANNNSATVEQMRFFAGFAAPDTSVLAGVDDYIGFASADGSGIIKLVADQTSGVPVTGASTSTNLLNINTSNHNLVNKWFTLSFKAEKLNVTSQEGTVYAHVDYHRKPTGASDFSPTHLGTINLDTNSDVPGAAMCPTIAFNAGEAVAKQLHIAKVICAAKYKLGA
jgi:hypothetical protein